MTFLAVITILVGALQAAGGVQELVVQGVLNNRLYPLVGGTLGTVAGVFILATGIALFRRSPEVVRLARTTRERISSGLRIDRHHRPAGWTRGNHPWPHCPALRACDAPS